MIQKILFGTIAIVVFTVFFYGTFWLAEHGSYALWYEDMVIQTIHEQVKTGCLKEVAKNEF